MENLPVYYYSFDYNNDETGVEFWSLVESPAIEVNWVKMKEELKKIKYAQVPDKQMLYGPVLIPEQPIYRNSPETGEFYGKFTKETIELLSRKFFKAQRTLNINYEHQDNSIVPAVITESWIVGKNDKSKDMGFDLPEGTWFGGVYIENTNFWNENVVTGKVNGFSIEGWLSMEIAQAQLTKETKQNTMIKKVITKTKLAEAKLKDGSMLSTPDAEIAIGSAVSLDGGKTPAPDADYELEDGTKLTVVGGLVTDIVSVEDPNAPADMAAETEEVFELTSEDVAKLTEAIQPLFDTLNAKIKAIEVANAAMFAENKALKESLSKIPGLPVAQTVKTDEEVKVKSFSKMSIEEKAEMLKTRFGK